MNAQTVTTRRDVYGIVVPSGEPVTIPQGSEVRLTQTLGTSLTVLHDGRLVRVAGEDADVLRATYQAKLDSLQKWRERTATN